MKWVGLILFIALLANGRRLPPESDRAGAHWRRCLLLVWGWRVWSRAGGPPSRGRVTYWRGQRIETAPPPRGPAMPRLKDIGPAAIYLLLGGVLLLSGIVVILQRFGL